MIRNLVATIGVTVPILIIGMSCPAAAQEGATGPAPLSVSLGTVRTEAERAAVRLAVDYAKRITASDLQLNGSRSMFLFAPEVKIETGEADAFNGVVVKLGGVLAVFDSIQVDSDDPTEPKVWTPDSRYFHTFPISIGTEMNRDFSTVVGLAEFGWVPWFQGKAPGQLKTLFVGIFVQGGYHFDRADAGADGGSADQSDEQPQQGLARIKASARFAPTWVLETASMTGVGLVGSGDVWLDLVNGATYYRLDATFRIRLDSDRFFDFKYQKGSGAPNFNKGDQFSANVTVQF